MEEKEKQTNKEIEKTTDSIEDKIHDTGSFDDDSSEGRYVAEHFMGMAMSQMRSGISEIASKLTPQHIDKLLDESGKDNEREYKDRNYQRWFIIGIIALGIAVLIFLTLYLAKDNESIFMKILIPILTFLGGVGAGYGIGKKS